MPRCSTHLLMRADGEHGDAPSGDDTALSQSRNAGSSHVHRVRASSVFLTDAERIVLASYLQVQSLQEEEMSDLSQPSARVDLTVGKVVSSKLAVAASLASVHMMVRGSRSLLACVQSAKLHTTYIFDC